MKNTLKQGIWLEYTTMLWNIVGCIIVIFFATKTASTSLLGFGIDSIIEIFASIIVIWQLKSINKKTEKFAMEMIGISFVLLSIFIASQVAIVLLYHHQTHSSLAAIIWLFITANVMFALAHGKKIVGEKLQHPVLLAEAQVTIIDGLLAVAVLLGLLLTRYAGIWWADSIASLVIVFYGMREAIHIFR